MSTTTETITHRNFKCDCCGNQYENEICKCHYCGRDFCPSAPFDGKSNTCGISGGGKLNACVKCCNLGKIRAGLKMEYAAFDKKSCALTSEWTKKMEKVISENIRNPLEIMRNYPKER